MKSRGLGCAANASIHFASLLQREGWGWMQGFTYSNKTTCMARHHMFNILREERISSLRYLQVSLKRLHRFVVDVDTWFKPRTQPRDITWPGYATIHFASLLQREGWGWMQGFTYSNKTTCMARHHMFNILREERISSLRYLQVTLKRLHSAPTSSALICSGRGHVVQAAHPAT